MSTADDNQAGTYNWLNQKVDDNAEIIETKTAGTTPTINNSVARFDGTDGLTIQSSNIVVSDDGSVGVGTTSPTYKIDIRTPGTISSQFHLSSPDTDAGGYLLSGTDSQLAMTAGVSFDGVNYIAKAIQAEIHGMQFAVHQFFADNSLTPGNSYTPTEVARMASVDSSAGSVAPATIGNLTYNRFIFPAIGAGVPAFTNRSNGTKIVLFPLMSGSTVDGAMGIQINGVWFSTFGNSSSYTFNWYGGTTEVMRLQGDGELLVKAGGATGFAKVGGVVQGTDHYTDANNSGTTETDLYSDTIPANALNNNGDKLETTYQLVATGAVAATQQMRIYFGGTLIYDSGALSMGAITSNFTFEVLVVRVSATVVRCSVAVSSDFATLFPYSKYTEVTGLTLSNSNVLKITGTAAGASGASNQVTAKLSSGIYWIPEA